MGILSQWAAAATFLTLAACGGEAEEPLQPLTGDETRYLAFQVFLGTGETWMPWVDVVRYTPKDKVAATVQDIVATIGMRGTGKAKLAFVVGPIAPDHTDLEAVQSIDDAFAIALEMNVAVGLHLDDSMFWSRRPDLMGNPANVEKVDWAGPASTGLELDWARPPAKMCLNAPAIQAEVTRRARMVIGPAIAQHVAALEAKGQGQLFAGVIAGWETHMGRDVASDLRLGFCALGNRGFSPNNLPPDVNAEVAAIVSEHIDRWADGLVQAGVAPDRVYSHVAFLPRARFDRFATDGKVPPGVRYEDVVDSATSTQRPAVAFGAKHRPGYTTYPELGVYDQIYAEVASHGGVAWASSEGTNVLPGQAAGSSGIGMEAYLARGFNHGAALIDVFSWGVGGPSVKTSSPFRLVTEGDEALAAYRKFLRQ
jgi:hypothetical protein